MSIGDSVIAASDATIENVTVVVEGNLWNIAISTAGIVVTAFVSWWIYRGNSKRADDLATAERQRHRAEIKRLKSESAVADARHQRQLSVMRDHIEAIREQGRHEREIKFLVEASDFLLEMSAMSIESAKETTPQTALRLRQFSARTYADFPVDDPSFSVGVGYFLTDLAYRVEINSKQTDKSEASDAAELIALDASLAAMHLSQWHIGAMRHEPRQAFEDYRKYRNFFGMKQYGSG